MVKLSDLVDIRGGGTPSRTVMKYWNGDIPWVTVKDIKDLVIERAEESITSLGLEESSSSYIPAGNIIIPTRMALGRVAINATGIAINQDIKALMIREPRKVDVNYLAFFLRSKAEYIISCGKGATVKGITVDVLRNIDVPLPDFSVQQSIVGSILKAENMFKQSQKMESELNTLAQAVFLEMFGDPVCNSNDYNKVTLLDVVSNHDDIKCGPFGTQLQKDEYLHEGIPLWGIKHVNSGFKKKTVEFVSEIKFKELKSYSLHPGDIVMTRKGTVGNCHLYPKNFPAGVMHSDLLKIKVDKKVIVPEFLVYQLKFSKDVERQISLISHGAIMAGINVGKLKNLEIFLPPYTSQVKFVNFVSALEQEVEKIHLLQDKYSDMFNALMQRAFSGKLDLKKVA